jgi:hypothetical protein
MVLEIYNAKLSKRLERRKFVFDRGFLEYKKNQAAEKKRTPKERELVNSVRVYAQLQTSEDHDKFVEGLMKEMQLRDRIAELQEFRANGLTTLAAGQEYLREKSNRVSEGVIAYLWRCASELQRKGDALLTDKFVYFFVWPCTSRAFGISCLVRL